MQTPLHKLRRTTLLLSAGLLFAVAPCIAAAQDEPQPIPSPACTSKEHLEAATSTQTFYLRNAANVGESNEDLVAIRNVLCPNVKIFLVSSQNAIVMTGTQEELRVARKLLSEVDRPHRNYRLTATLTTLDDGKRSGTQHFTIVLVSGQRTVLKQGSKIPVITGSTKPDSATVSNAVQYLDVGANFDFTLDEVANGLRLKSKIEQSSVAPEQSNAASINDPVIRQMVIEGTSLVAPGKSLILGSIDVIGSTRRIDISVEIEPLT